MKRIILFVLFAFVVTTNAISQQYLTYSIQFTTNAGAAAVGNNYLGDTIISNNAYAGLLPNLSSGKAQWYIIPAGGEIYENEPGWYYIQNVSNGRYLQAVGGTIGGTLVLYNGDPSTQNTTKWRLIKTTGPTTTTDASSHYFRLLSRADNENPNNQIAISKNNNNLILTNQNATNNNFNATNATVRIERAVGELNAVFNENMEITTNYTRISNTLATWPNLPPVRSNADISANDWEKWNTDTGNAYFPAGYERSNTTNAYAVHSHVSSGPLLGDGYYFTRLTSDGTNHGFIRLQALENHVVGMEYEIGAWARVSAPDGYSGDLTIMFYTTWGTTGSRSYPITPALTVADKDDSDGWVYYRGIIPQDAGITAGQRPYFRITNDRGPEVVLDIDNFQIIQRQIRDFDFHHQGYDQASMPNPPEQAVHSLTRVIYTLPNSLEELRAVSPQYSYYRWYNPNDAYAYLTNDITLTDDNRYIGFPTAQGSAFTNNIALNTPGTARSYFTKHGLFYFGSNTTALGGGGGDYGGNALGQTVRFIPPGDLNDIKPSDKAYRVICEASTYTNFTTDLTNGIVEPTLSFRNHFDLRPAWNMAYEIDSALFAGSVREYHELDAPSGTITGNFPDGGTNAYANSTRIRLSPQYLAFNYWFTDIAKNAIDATTLSAAYLTSATLFHGSTFEWRQSDDTWADGSIITGGATANNILGNVYSFPTGSGSATGANTYLQINTRGKTGTEYYKVYVVSGIERKEIARFKVNYYSKDEVGPKNVPVNNDLLAAVKNKRLLTKQDFDRIDPESGAPKNKFGFGIDPLNIAETSYGFVNPELFAYTGEMLNNNNTGNNHNGQGYHRSVNFPGWYGEYSLPRGIHLPAALGTGSAVNDAVIYNTSLTAWLYPDPVYDITSHLSGGSINTPGSILGNFFYVDAAETPGVFATLNVKTALCPGAQLYFSAWIVNLNTQTATQNDAAINAEISTARPNLIFILKDSDTNQEIKRFYTGDIGRPNQTASLDRVGIWQQVAFDFVIPTNMTVTDFTLEVQNNGLGTNGNDFGIDDICIYRSNPPIIAVRTAEIFCKPDEGDPIVPLEMKVDVDLDEVTADHAAGTDKIYYRFFNGKMEAFPLSENIYIGGYHEILNTDDADDGMFSYGIIDLGLNPDGIPNITDNPLLEHVILRDGDGRQIAWMDNNKHLIFFQEIPASVLGGNGGITGSNESYGVWVGEAVENLFTPSCSGVGYFSVTYDMTDISANVEGSTLVQDLETVAICTNRALIINASTRDGLTDDPLFTYYDWYKGPLTDKTVNPDDQEEINYDPDINYTGFNVYSDNQRHPGYYLKWDLMAFRHYYKEADFPENSQIAALFTAGGGTAFPFERTFMIEGTAHTLKIESEQDLSDLILRIRDYVKYKKLSLHERNEPMTFKTKVTYYMTIIPIDKAVFYQKDGSGNFLLDADGNYIPEVGGIQAPICTTPFEIFKKPNEWGPEIVFGEVQNDGSPAKPYLEIDDPNYTYTIRLSEDDADSFVIPMLFLDETHLLKIDLMEVVDDNGAIFTPATPIKANHIHLGTIDPSHPNKLVQNQQVWITHNFSSDFETLYPLDAIDGTAAYPMNTYWDMDSIRVEPTEAGAFRYVLEGYPILITAYNYYTDDPLAGHELLREGDPLPLGTLINGHPLENNKLGLEVTSANIAGGTAPFLESGKFKAGYEYRFRVFGSGENEWYDDVDLSSVCDKEFYFRLRIVPNEVVWSPNGTNDSWNNDQLWKNVATAKNGFVPLHTTQVTLPSGLTIYPLLKDSADVKTWDANETDNLIPGIKETPYIEFDYNFVPNAAAGVYFEDGSELGKPFYLNYDSVKIDLHLNTQRWYGLSAPLRDMYSGDYSFEYINPVTYMELFNTINPQTKAPELLWTTPFNTTTVRLSAGTGFSVQIGKTRYHVVTETGANLSAGYDLIPDTTLVFPNDKMSFPFYNEITKKPTGQVENIPGDGRDFGKRFVYEITEMGKSVVPLSDTLVTVPSKVTTGDQLVVVGNPFMSHIDFAEFYRINQEVIKPEYKILDGPSITSISGVVYIKEEGLEDPISTGNLTWKSIPPMQTFLVTTKDDYTGSEGNLYITKTMSTVDETNSKLRTSGVKSNLLRIQVSNGNQATNAVVALSDRTHNEYVSAEDSRRVLGGVAGAPNVFTIIDGMYLDINRMQEMPLSLPIGISTTSKGNMQITLSGLDVLSGADDVYFFKDTKVPTQKLLLGSEDTFTYEFENTEGDQIGRFYIIREQVVTGNEPVVDPEKIQIYVRQGVIHVLSSNGTGINEVVIYNTDGSKIYQQNSGGSTHIEIPVVQLSNPVLIVKANAAKTTTTAKVVITY